MQQYTAALKDNPKEECEVVQELKEASDKKWMHDKHPNLMQHLEVERKLHVRGTDSFWDGWHWPTNHFKWNFNLRYNPENAVEMSMGYFMIPFSSLNFYGKQTRSTIFNKLLISRVDYTTSEDVDTDKYYFTPFFVHPESFNYFDNLFDGEFEFVKPEDSDYVGIPTSSYRSWLVRSTEYVRDPFIVKFGVMGANQDSSRMTSETNLVNIQETQNVFDSLSISKKGKFTFFHERASYSIKGNGSHACMIIREIPEHLLKNRIKIFSFEALMSMERTNPENHGLGSIIQGMESLPLMFEVMENAIKNGKIKNPVEFVRKYLIQDYVDAIEEVHMKKGKLLSLHSQNLCMFLKNDGLIPSAEQIQSDLLR